MILFSQFAYASDSVTQIAKNSLAIASITCLVGIFVTSLFKPIHQTVFKNRITNRHPDTLPESIETQTHQTQVF
jgi:hypothetical protein